jgi:uncharacterized protein (DUF4415 family)
MSSRKKGTFDHPPMNDDPIDDPDNPEWTEEDFARAVGPEGLSDVELAAFPKTRGRPRSPAPKKLVSLRLDSEVVQKLKATGPGWQTRANEILKRSLG